MERLDPEFGEDWATEYEEIDHYLTPILSKIVRFRQLLTKYASDNDWFLHISLVHVHKIPYVLFTLV